jgi:hypothetical protein
VPDRDKKDGNGAKPLNVVSMAKLPTARAAVSRGSNSR